MKTTKFLKAMLALGVIATCAFGMIACSGGGSSSGQVAATVNGTNIMEDDVTQQIHTMRVQNQMEQDEQWGLYLAMTNQTPSDVRTSAITALKNRELKKAGATDLGITLDASEVDVQLASIKANYGSDEKWAEALNKAGWTDQEYRAYIEDQVLTMQLGEYFQGKAEVDDATLVETANTYLTSYYNGLKRSSHILFKVENTSDEAAMAAAREKAQDVLNRINSGQISFEDAAKEYSDDSSKDNGGDVGWNNQDFVSEYLTAVDGLEVGQVSGLVESQFGIHIIKVTDKYTAPEKVESINDVPEDFREGIQNAASMVKAQSDYTEWLNGLSEAATFTQNDMPSGLPYDIDLTKYKKQYEEMVAAASASAESADTAEASGEAASGEAASSDAAASGEAAAFGEAASSEAASSDAAASSSSAASSDSAAASGSSASSESASQ